MTKNDVRMLEQTWLFQGFLSVKRYLLQHKLYAGGWSSQINREVVIRPHAAAMLPYDPVLDKVVLIEQFRAGALQGNETPWLVEIVAGLMQTDETPEQLACREAQEEAGLAVLELMPIYEYWASPGLSSERITLFCGRVDASNADGIHGLPEEHEDIRVFTVSAQEAFAMLQRGEIKNAFCLIALLWLQLHKEEVRAKWLATTV